jgi:flagellar motor protein MotB
VAAPVRTRSHAPEEENEGCFASISDLMVGILFIFLLMLTIFALNFADEDKDAEIRRLNAVVASLTTELAQRDSRITSLTAEFNRQAAELTRLRADEAERRRLLQTLAREIAAITSDIDTARERLAHLRAELLDTLRLNLEQQGVKVEVSADHDVLRLPSEEIFPSGSAAFTPSGRKLVQAVLGELLRLLPCYAAAQPTPAPGCATTEPIFETVLIEGHTDAAPFDNWRLSTDRARAVLNLIEGEDAALLALGNPSGQKLLGLAGYGDSRTLPAIPPLDARNRRIEFHFLLAPAPEQEAVKIRTRLEHLQARLEALGAP